LRALPKGSVIVLQLCAQNPTGVDPTYAQWGLVLAAVKDNSLFPFFDNAYQGEGERDPT